MVQTSDACMKVNNFFHFSHLFKVIEDIELPDTNFEPYDTAVLLAHLVTREESQTELLQGEKWNTAQNGYRRGTWSIPQLYPKRHKMETQYTSDSLLITLAGWADA